MRGMIHTWWDRKDDGSLRIPTQEELEIHIQDAIDRKDRMRRIVIKRALRQMLGRNRQHMVVNTEGRYVCCTHRNFRVYSPDVDVDSFQKVVIDRHFIVPLHRLHIFAGNCYCSKTYYRVKEMGFWET